jgi:hypothetical protein
MNYLSVENISKSYGENAFWKHLFGISKEKNCFIAKNGSEKLP